MCRKKTKSKKLKIFGFSIFVFLLLYVSSYCLLSFLGGYSTAKSGEYRLNTGLSFYDIEIWFPRFGYAQLFRTIDGKLTVHSDWVGLFYCPLILFDQKYIHKTRPFPTSVDKVQKD
jgi:hypothetical protein